MDERKELLQAIRRSRRKLNIAKLIDTCVFCLAYAGVAAIVLEAVSLWIPFYYVHLCVEIVIGIALIVGIIYAVIKRTSMREAAQQIDTFGLKERVQTAYEQMEDESPLAGMQRHDAAEQLQKKLDAKQIRIFLREDIWQLLFFPLRWQRRWLLFRRRRENLQTPDMRSIRKRRRSRKNYRSLQMQSRRWIQVNSRMSRKRVLPN